MRKQQIFVGIFMVAVCIGAVFGESSQKTAPIPYKESPFVKQEVGTVIRAVDGDTIIVEIDNKQERVRLIGVNTPESVDPRREVECFGIEAARFARGLLPPHTAIRLVSDPTQIDRDKYGRLLRYVFLADDSLINREIISNGYGYEYTYDVPYQHQANFKAAEQTARMSKKGLWTKDTCGIDFSL